MLAPGAPIAALQELPTGWVGWRLENRGKKKTKLPFQPGSGRLAESDNPRTWSNYVAAEGMQGCDGVGIMLAGVPELVVIDCDHCRDPKTGRIEPWAETILEEAQSYVELSPSGTGVHVLGIAHGLPKTIKSLPRGEGQQVEIFAGGAHKYTTVTFQRLDSFPPELNDIGPLVRELLAEAEGKRANRVDNANSKPNGANGADSILLTQLPNDYDRAEWIRLGLAHKASGGDFASFESWSAEHPSYDLNETRRVWESLAPSGAIGTGSIVHELRRRGIEVPAQKPERPHKPERQPAPEVYSAAALRLENFSPLAKIAGELVVEGLTLLAARPKIGKTWLALEVATSVEEGGTCLGGAIPCEKGEALFLALEDNKRRMQRRLTKLFGAFRQDWPALAIAHKWPRADQGGIEHLRRWLSEHPKARLVVIDVLARFRKPSPPGKQTFELDYEAVAQLQSLAAEFPGLAIVVIHHLRKSEGGDDPLDAISGTLGLNAAADAVLIISKNSQGTTLYGRSRDVDEVDKALKWDAEACRWSILGDRDAVQRSEERKQILDLLATVDEMNPKGIAEALGRPEGTIGRLLFNMVESGEVEKRSRGRYALAAKKPRQWHDDD